MQNPVPELWAFRNRFGAIGLWHGGPEKLTRHNNTTIDPTLIAELNEESCCRIAWDEKGIRLIGSQQPIPTPETIRINTNASR